MREERGDGNERNERREEMVPTLGRHGPGTDCVACWVGTGVSGVVDRLVPWRSTQHRLRLGLRARPPSLTLTVSLACPDSCALSPTSDPACPTLSDSD